MRYLSALLMSFLSVRVFAVASVDREVAQFMNSGLRMNGVMSVFVKYKIPALPRRPLSPAYHAEIETTLQQATLTQERILLATTLKGSLVQARTYWIAGGSIMELNRQQLALARMHPMVERISHAQRRMSLPRVKYGAVPTENMPYTYGLTKIGVPTVRTPSLALTGQGVRVGILDTGVDPQHPDLKGKIKLFKDFTDHPSMIPVDTVGHGTHVAGTIVGGASSGTAIGIAPQATLIVGRIFDAAGGSSDELILRAMQWLADPDGNPKTNDFPQIINNSWGDDAPYGDRDPQDDPMCRAVENWVKLGILPVFAVGNSGPGISSLGVPAACPASLTVAATDSQDNEAFFSARGPTRWKSYSFIKPEISAPGVDIMSAKPGGGYQTLSGTSMATPHITGILALLLQARPNASIEVLLRALAGGAVDLGIAGDDSTFGYGRADVVKSLSLLGVQK